LDLRRFPKKLPTSLYLQRKVRYFDKESAKLWVFLINNLEIPVLNVVKLYKNRWQIELFLKRIKRPPPHQALLRDELPMR